MEASRNRKSETSLFSVVVGNIRTALRFGRRPSPLCKRLPMKRVLSWIWFSALGIFALQIYLNHHFGLQRFAQIIFKESTGALSELNEVSLRAVDELEKRLIRQKARDVAGQFELLARAGAAPEEYERFGIQPVGSQGYTSVYECGTGIMRYHPNKQLVGKKMEFLKEKLPTWWAIYRPSLECVEIEGYYKWIDADGSERQKYMVMTPVRGTKFMVAATAYVNDPSSPILMLSAAKRDLLSQVKNHAAQALHMTNIATIALGFIALFAFYMLLSIVSGRMLSYLEELTRYLNKISRGEAPGRPRFRARIHELAEIQRKLRRTNLRLRDFQRRKEADAKDMAKYDLARSVAHDLRSPLALLKALSLRMKSSQTIDVQTARLGTAVSERIQSLVNELLSEGQKDSSKVSDSFEAFSLNAFLKENTCLLNEQIGALLQDKAPEILLSQACPDIEICLPKLNLQRAVSNLVQNAAEAHATKVHVSGRMNAQKQLEIEVRDNGVGMSADLLAHVREKGFSYGKSSGSGLGLSIIEEILKGQNAQLSFSSTPGSGTVATIIFRDAVIQRTSEALNSFVDADQLVSVCQ